MHDAQLSQLLLVWAIYFGCTGVVSVLSHRYFTSANGANFLTAFVAVLVLAAVDTIRLGYFDGWLLVAAPIAGSVALLLSVLIGALSDRLGISRRTSSARHGA